jgi:hypothetical protein
VTRGFIGLVLAVAVSMLAVHAAGLGTARGDGSASMLSLYRSAKPALPERGYVAFVPTDADPVAGGATRFLAQYALAPLVLVDDIASAPAAITGPAAGESVDRMLVERGLSLDFVLSGGIRVYRR